MSDVASRLRELIAEKKGFTFQALADHVGVTRSAASQWKVTGGITSAHLAAVATFFEVYTEWLQTGRGPKYLNDSATNDAALSQSGEEKQPGGDKRVNKADWLRLAARVKPEHFSIAMELIEPFAEDSEPPKREARPRKA